MAQLDRNSRHRTPQEDVAAAPPHNRLLVPAHPDGGPGLRDVLDSLFAFVGVLTTDGTLIEANRAALQAASLRSEDVLNQPFEQAYWWSYSPQVQQQLREAIERGRRGEASRYDVLIRLGEQHFITIDFMLAPMFNEQGQISYLIPSAIDISARKQVEAEREQLLRRAEEARDRTQRLQALTAALAAASTSKEAATVILEHSTSALGVQGGVVGLLSSDGKLVEIIHATGYPPEVVSQWRHFSTHLPVPIADVIQTRTAIFIESLADAAAHYPQLQLERSQFQAWATVPLLVNDKVLGAVDFSFVAPRSFSTEDRAFLQALGTLCAQTFERIRLYEAEQRARAAAEEAVRIRDSFLSIAAHELKNPLTAVLGQAQLLRRRIIQQAYAPDRDRRSIDIIVGQAQRIDEMITTLLDTSRLERGQLELTRAPLDICGLVRRVVTAFQPLLTRHSLMYDIVSAPLIISGDANRMEQVLQNLIQNAIKYSPEGGAIQVYVDRHEQEAWVAVRDHGIGIPTADIPRLFRQFYRASNAQKRFVSGVGVGLYVVKEIVTLHNGRVLVESIEGQGSTFTICLPLC